MQKIPAVSSCPRRRRRGHTLQSISILLPASFLVCAATTGCFGGCLNTLANGEQQAQTLAAEMHTRMANGDLAGIYDATDQQYKNAMTRQKSDALFTAIANKLGAPHGCNQQGFNINATTSGTTLRLVCGTTFSKNATATETFVWLKSDNQFRLLKYYIESNELVER